MGGGIQVFVRGGRLMLRLLTPIPALYRGFPLHPDDELDPYVFRLDLSQFGMATVRLVFSRAAEGGIEAVHTDLGSQPLSFDRRPAASRRTWTTAAIGALTAGAMVGAARRRSASVCRKGSGGG
jgi:hypothetical protein